MPEFRILLPRLCLIGVVTLAAGCRYSGPYVETRDEVKLTYLADPSTSVYRGTEKIGEYRFERFEGQARAVLAGGEDWHLDAEKRASSRRVVQPFSAARLVLKKISESRVEMDHGAGPKVVLQFVTGSWEAFATGQDVVMRFEEASWQAWIHATENAVLDLLDDYRKRTFAQLDRNQEMTEARVLDLLVDEKPLLRANRRELMIFFEAVRIEGGFEISTREKDPSYRWWSYELRPEVGDALASATEALVIAAVASIEVCAHCVSHCP
jgi:hypothetical protein